MAQEWSQVRRILSACENTPRKQDKSPLSPRFLQNTELFLECVFVLLPGAADRNKFTSDCSLLLAGVIQVNV